MSEEWDPLAPSEMEAIGVQWVGDLQHRVGKAWVVYPLWDALFRVAWALAKTARGAAKERCEADWEGGEVHAIPEIRSAAAAVLLAIAAAEGYINTCIDFAGRVGELSQDRVHWYLDERNHPPPVDVKWRDFPTEVLGERVFDPGEYPLCEFRSLKDVRDYIAHLEPRMVEVPAETQIREARVEVRFNLREWLELLLSRGISADNAVKACNVVADMVSRLRQYLYFAPGFFGKEGPPRL